MRNIGKYRRKKQKKILIIGSLSILLFLCVGYAAFSTNLKVMTKANIKERSDYYVSSNGSDTTGKGTKNSPYQTIQKAYDVALDYKEVTIHVMDNLTVTKTIDFDKNKIIKITSYSKEGLTNSIIRDNNLTTSLLYQTSGNLTLENIILDGNNVHAESPILFLNENTYTLLSNNTTIKNGYNNSGEGGGIKVTSNGKIFDENTVLVIDGATITNNIAKQSGGGISGSGAIINLISGNITSNSMLTSNTQGDGGGIHTWGSNLTISGGTINNNEGRHGSAIIASQSQITMTGGIIEKNTAVDGTVTIWNSSSFILEGGIIKNNKASSNKNGGLWINPASPAGKYTYKSGVVCGNIPANQYETSSTCPS